MINVIIQTFPVLKTKQTHTGPSSVMSRRHCLFVQPHQWGGNKCWSRSFFPFFPWPPPLDSLITSTFWCLDLFIPPNNCAYRFMQSPLITHPPSGVLLQARFFFSVLISGLSFFSKLLTPLCTGTNFLQKYTWRRVDTVTLDWFFTGLQMAGGLSHAFKSVHDD